MIIDPQQHVGQPSQRIEIVELGGLDQGVDGGGTAAAIVGGLPEGYGDAALYSICLRSNALTHSR